MVVAALYLFVTCYTAGFTVGAVTDNLEPGLANFTRVLPLPGASYDPFFQSRLMKQQAGNIREQPQ